MKLHFQVTLEDKKNEKVLPNKPPRMTQTQIAMKESVDANDFIAEMKTNAETKIMKTSMVLPKIRHSLEPVHVLAT